jgi:glycosyltransferase involved in cell wall biosynthesis
MNETPPFLSVVIPVYNEEGNVVPLFNEIIDTLAKIDQKGNYFY